MNNTKRKAPKIFIAILVIIFLLILIALFSSNSENNTTEISNTVSKTTLSTTQKEIITIRTDAKSLISDYKENEAAANKKYKSNTLIVSKAIVYSVDNNYIKFECENNDFWIYYIDAYYNSDQKETVSRLQKGDSITIVGECKGLSSWGDIKLWNCIFE